MGSSGPRPSVLVVDDELELLGPLLGYLDGEGFDVVQASDGIDAISCLHARRPDVVLVDLFMPRMNGLELIKQIRSDPYLAQLGVIAMSGMAPMLVRAQTAGANDILCKPIDPDLLVRTLIRHGTVAARGESGPGGSVDAAIDTDDRIPTEEFCAKTELTIHASPTRIWETLTTPELAQEYVVGGDVLIAWALRREGDVTVVSVSQHGLGNREAVEARNAHWRLILRALKKTVEG
jgi:CheY-like chemotaxis protein